MDRDIRDISDGAADSGERLNEIADRFRRGRDVNEFVALLDSDDSELVSIGAWILGEIHFELYDVGYIVTRLWNWSITTTPPSGFTPLERFTLLSSGRTSSVSLC